MKHIKANIQTLTYEDEMATMLRRITMESESLNGFASTVASLVPNMATKTKDFITKFFDSNSGVKEVKDIQVLPGDLTEFLLLMERRDYMGIAPMAINVPEGFTGDLVAYTAFLLDSAEHSQRIISDILNPFNTFLSSLVTNKDAQRRVQQDLVFLAKADAQRNKLNQESSRFFKHGSNQARLELGKAIRRNADWRQVFINLRKATEEIQKTPNSSVQNVVNDCVSLLNAIKSSSESQELDKISPEMLKTLADRTLTVAKEVEFFAITSFRIIVANTVMEQNVKQLKDHFKKK